MDDRVSIRRITSEATDDVDPRLVLDAMRELGPEGGDFVVLRATRDRATAIEQGLVNQLFTMGAYVADEPLGSADEPLDENPYFDGELRDDADPDTGPMVGD